MTEFEILQEISGLLGAVDGKVLERVRRIIQRHTVAGWYISQLGVDLDKMLEPQTYWLNKTLEQQQETVRKNRKKVHDKYIKTLREIDDKTINFRIEIKGGETE